MKRHLTRSHWTGNGWPSIEIDPFEAADFLPVLVHLCQRFAVTVPPVVDLLDGYASDVSLHGVLVRLHLDLWSFSLATPDERMRDQVLIALEDWTGE